jgi:hypothetical protein
VPVFADASPPARSFARGRPVGPGSPIASRGRATAPTRRDRQPIDRAALRVAFDGSDYKRRCAAFDEQWRNAGDLHEAYRRGKIDELFDAVTAQLRLANEHYDRGRVLELEQRRRGRPDRSRSRSRRH